MVSDTVVDYSTTNQRTMRGPLLAFVRRHRDPSLRDILHWFRSTPGDFVQQQINEALAAGELTIQLKAPWPTDRIRAVLRARSGHSRTNFGRVQACEAEPITIPQYRSKQP